MGQGLIQRLLIWLFGVNYRTSVAGIMSVVVAIPAGIAMIQSMYHWEVLPEWLTIASVVCSVASYIYMTIQSKAQNVTGAGKDAEVVGKNL